MVTLGMLQPLVSICNLAQPANAKVFLPTALFFVDHAVHSTSEEGLRTLDMKLEAIHPYNEFEYMQRFLCPNVSF